MLYKIIKILHIAKLLQDFVQDFFVKKRLMGLFQCHLYQTAFLRKSH